MVYLFTMQSKEEKIQAIVLAFCADKDVDLLLQPKPDDEYWEIMSSIAPKFRQIPGLQGKSRLPEEYARWLVRYILRTEEPKKRRVANKQRRQEEEEAASRSQAANSPNPNMNQSYEGGAYSYRGY